MLSLLSYLAAGAAMGWLASLLLRTSRWQERGVNLGAGMAGAVLAGWLAPPLVGAAPLAQNSVSLEALAVAVLGAMLVLAVVAMARRRPFG
ncbi:MAG: GlsB/YeaQ/YmgE family stress response membrane protein [Pseudomonadota bacterium]